jgi:magnesium chelatase family protein
MIAAIPSATLVGASGEPVFVEVHVDGGLPGFTMVGLPDAAARESRDRVRAAVTSTGFRWPQQRITVNLAPSSVRKGGAGLDLPIAIGVLVASGQLPPARVDGVAFAGELGLDGSLRHVPGMISLSEAAQGRRFVVPTVDAVEAALVGRGGVYGMPALRRLVDVLRGDEPWPPPAEVPSGGGCPSLEVAKRAAGPGSRVVGRHPDLADVRGQRVGRRALEVAAAGGHHLLMVGPPGSGKSMLACRLPGILPDLSPSVALEVCRVQSAAGIPLPGGTPSRRPPFRSPHHGASAVSMIGGGTALLRPGEISLASGGVLFLDEMGEFPPSVLDSLRQPLEEGVVRVSRARAAVTYPARFLLVAAMNPCPCGDGATPGACRCTQAARARYSRRLSGPLFDRFDLVVPLDRPDPDELVSATMGEASAAVAGRVERVRAIAEARGVGCNADLSRAALEEWAPLTPSARRFLETRVRSGSLSGRGLDRVRKVARTVADLSGGPDVVAEEHVAEAMALRAGRGCLGIDADRRAG